MNKLFILICTLLISVNSSFAAMGAYDAGSLNREYMRDMRLHEIQTRERNKTQLIQKEKEREIEKKASEIPSVTIQIINFSGNEEVPSKILHSIVASNIGQTATEQNISAMRKLITKFYNSNGYYSAIVAPDISNLPNGELIFQIRENQKNSIIIE